jgi:hypothetical protein
MSERLVSLIAVQVAIKLFPAERGLGVMRGSHTSERLNARVRVRLALGVQQLLPGIEQHAHAGYFPIDSSEGIAILGARLEVHAACDGLQFSGRVHKKSVVSCCKVRIKNNIV